MNWLDRVRVTVKQAELTLHFYQSAIQNYYIGRRLKNGIQAI